MIKTYSTFSWSAGDNISICQLKKKNLKNQFVLLTSHDIQFLPGNNVIAFGMY